MKNTSTSAIVQFIGSDWTKLFCFCFVIMASAVASSQNVWSQNEASAAGDEEEPLVVQVYDVSEFVTQSYDQPFDGFVIPGVSADQHSVFMGGDLSLIHI